MPRDTRLGLMTARERRTPTGLMRQVRDESAAARAAQQELLRIARPLSTLSRADLRTTPGLVSPNMFAPASTGRAASRPSLVEHVVQASPDADPVLFVPGKDLVQVPALGDSSRTVTPMDFVADLTYILMLLEWFNLWLSEANRLQEGLMDLNRVEIFFTFLGWHTLAWQARRGIRRLSGD